MMEIKMMEINLQLVHKFILAGIWLQFMWTMYLSIRQYVICKETVKVPHEIQEVMTQEMYKVARSYALEKSCFEMAHELFCVLRKTYVMHYGVFYKLWSIGDTILPNKGEIIQGCFWSFIINLFDVLFKMPFSAFYTFALKERTTLNKQTAAFFLMDQVKIFCLSQVFEMLESSFVVYVVLTGGDYFYVWLWLMISALMIIQSTIFPSYIAPLLDKYTPLPAGQLRTQIVQLTASLSFPLEQVYVIESTGRSAHSNVYITGVFGRRRIVLYDTILPINGGCSNEEILALLAHELGHWKLSHNFKNLVLTQANLFLRSAMFAFLFKSSCLYMAFGFPPGVEPILVGLTIVLEYVMSPCNDILSFLLKYRSRYFEFQADQFTAFHGKSKKLQSAIIKLEKPHLSFPVNDHLYSAWYFSHPTTLERIKALEIATQ